MHGASPVTGEVSNHKVAAIFDSEQQARAAATALQDNLQLGGAQVQVLTSADRRPRRKLEPETRGIFRTIIVAHLRLGIAGTVLGAVVFAVLYAMGIPMIVQSPFAAGAAIVAFGAVAGLLLGGLVSLRPDHDAYIQSVYSALAAGRAAVVVHAFSAAQRASAAEDLRARGGETTSTL